jgi:hypothetical protein
MANLATLGGRWDFGWWLVAVRELPKIARRWWVGTVRNSIAYLHSPLE